MSERQNLQAAMAALEAQRSTLGDAVVDSALGPLEERLAELEREPSQEQRKLVTVLFADVSGFTSLSQRMDPENVAQVINNLWRKVDATIEAHGGTVDKHVGDAVMALFGDRVAREDDAERAVLAALALQDIVPKVSAELGSDPECASLAMRVGLHTGTVHLGRVGSGHEYTAIGDTVNVASRIESAAPRGGILISSETQSHVRGRFDLVDKGLIELRGRTEPMRVYEVSCRRAPEETAESVIGGLEVPLVGREEELARLDEIAARVAAGAGASMVTVFGDKGLGASRLISSFARRLRKGESHGVEVLEARSGAGGAVEASYRVLRDLVFTRFALGGAKDADLAGAIEESLAALPYFAGRESRVVEERAHLLGHLMGLRLDGSRHLIGEGAELRRRAFVAAADLFRALSFGCELLVVIVEDLHSADDGSLDLLRHAISACSDLHVFVVGSARSTLLERRPDWVDDARRFKIDLGPLDERSSGRLLDALLARVSSVPASLRSRLLSAAEGHPLYVEELVRHLIESGVVDASGPEWKVRSETLGDLEIPSTLTALVQARLDVLSPVERRVLERAAVMGRIFWDSALVAMRSPGEEHTSLFEQELGSALRALEKRGILSSRDSSVFAGSRELSFSQQVLHDVAYDMVLLRKRPDLHRAAARWLIEHAASGAPGWARRIADHFERAGDGREAGLWLLEAGREADRTYDLRSATELYERGLEHLEQDESSRPRRLLGLNGLFRAYWARGQHPQAEKVCERMRSEASSAGDKATESSAWGHLSLICAGRNEAKRALDASERAVSLARLSCDPRALEAGLRARAQSLHHAGRFGEAIQLLEEALVLASDQGLVDEQARSLRLLAQACTRLGLLDEAEAHCRRACDIFRELNHRSLLAASLISLGELARMRRDPKEALSHYEEALAIVRELGLMGHELVALVNKGAALNALGRHQAAEAVLEEVVERAPERWYGLSETWRFLAEARIARASWVDALAAALSAMEHARQAGSSEMIGAAWRVIAELASEQGLPVALDGEEVDSELAFKRSLEVLDAAGASPEAIGTIESWARHCVDRGDPERGIALLKEASARRLGDLQSQPGSERG